MKTIWDYKYRFLVYLFLLAVIMAVAIWTILYEAKPLTEANSPISECFYEQPRIPFHPKTITLGTLVDKLIDCESGGNNEAIGKAGEIGILQFKPATFKHFCVDRYGMKDDIYHREIQKQCCQMMINDGLANHWICYDIVK